MRGFVEKPQKTCFREGRIILLGSWSRVLNIFIIMVICIFQLFSHGKSLTSKLKRYNVTNCKYNLCCPMFKCMSRRQASGEFCKMVCLYLFCCKVTHIKIIFMGHLIARSCTHHDPELLLV